jgi:hypothetical protein
MAIAGAAARLASHLQMAVQGPIQQLYGRGSNLEKGELHASIFASWNARHYPTALDATNVNAASFLRDVRLATRKPPPCRSGSALIQVPRLRATELSLRPHATVTAGYYLINNGLGAV